MGDKEKSKRNQFSFKRKPPPVEEYNLDSDFIEILSDSNSSADLFEDEIVDESTTKHNTNDDIEMVNEVTNPGSSTSSSTSKGETQQAWSHIMSKMRYQTKEVRAEKQEQAAKQWKGLMGAMQKNQQKSSFVSVMKSKSKNSKNKNSVKRQTKQPLKNPNIKRIKSTEISMSKVTTTTTIQKSESQVIIDSIDLELSDLELSENMPEEMPVQRKKTTETTPKSVPTLPICPIFLPKSARTSNNHSQSKLQEIKQKILQVQSSENPWTRKASSSSNDSWLPEVIQLNDLGGEDGEESRVQGKNNNKRPPKTCPFYKKLPGTKFSVDAFDCGVIPGIDVYFLSHFHSDHYKGLTKKFRKTIICSSPTGNLVEMKLGVDERCIRRLELNKVYIIQGVEVVLIDANHCPGSVMFMLRLPNGTNYLHTGDFRYTSDMMTNHYLNHLRVDCLYLDTTYCDPQYDFPLQCDAIAQVILTVKKHMAYKPKTLICVGSYCIGKERVFCAVADAIGSKVFCDPNKLRVLRALENQYFQQLLSENEANCRVHVLEMAKLNPTYLSEHLKQRSQAYTNIFAIKPTGWEFSKGTVKSTGSSVRSFCNDSVAIMGVAYSEHSSFSELKEFVSIVKPVKVQPTVNVGEPKRTAMMAHIQEWLINGYVK